MTAAKLSARRGSLGKSWLDPNLRIESFAIIINLVYVVLTQNYCDNLLVGTISALYFVPLTFLIKISANVVLIASAH